MVHYCKSQSAIRLKITDWNLGGIIWLLMWLNSNCILKMLYIFCINYKVKYSFLLLILIITEIVLQNFNKVFYKNFLDTIFLRQNYFVLMALENCIGSHR